jgi:hypothetical protein
MRRALAATLAAAAALAGAAYAAAPAAPPKTTQCKGVKNCVTVPGPWVAVAPNAETVFLLECPKRQGIIAGIDALSSSKAVRVTWEAKLGTPVRAGTSTGFLAFFHAWSSNGRPGSFQPVLGCIPPPKVNERSPLSARATVITKPGDPVNRWQISVPLKPGARQTVARACGGKKNNKERLIGGWSAITFGTKETTTPPNANLASKVHLQLTIGDVRVVASVRTDASMPEGAIPKVQVGAVCTK